MKKIFTGERLETSIRNGNSINHLHRYVLVNKYITDKVVLDIASGEGYGSNLMSNHASHVFGVDIDRDAIKMAKKKYKKQNLEFIIGSTSNIPLSNNCVDVVVSFETIEHHDKHEEMLSEIKRVLKPNGILIISTPDKYYYSDLRNYNNEFHVKELYKSEFVELIENYFSTTEILSQSYLNGNSIILDQNTREKMRFYTGNYSKLESTVSNPQFIIAISSDFEFVKLENSIFDGGEFMNTDMYEKDFIKNIYESNSYRLGHSILLPIKYFKKIFKAFKNK